VRQLSQSPKPKAQSTKHEAKEDIMGGANKYALLGIYVLILSIAGCGRDTGANGKVIARINDYSLTIEDFMSEADAAFTSRYLPKDHDQAKERLLDELITKKILILEAQDKGLDKKKQFMKEIERYWEQSLLKSLVREKSNEVQKKIGATKEEVKKEYNRMNRVLFAELYLIDGKINAERLYQASLGFDETKKRLAEEGKLLEERTEWWQAGDLPEHVEDVVFELKTGRWSRPVKLEDKWCVARLVDVRDSGIGPLPKVYDSIEKRIVDRKRDKALERWMSKLRQKASITVNRKLLEEIKIGRGNRK